MRAWLTWHTLRDACSHDLSSQSEAWRKGARRDGKPLVYTPIQHDGVPVTLFCTRAAPSAVRQQLKAMVPPGSTLVTAHTDVHVTDEAAREILGDGSPFVRWFAVQVATTHPGLIPVPVGLDPVTLPILASVTPKPWDERRIRVYLNCKRRNAIRDRLYREAPPWWTVRDWEPPPDWKQRPGPWRDQTRAYYEDLANAQFVLSPPGQGWDCYRTYEAVALGARLLVDAAWVPTEVPWLRCSTFYPLESPHVTADAIHAAYWIQLLHGKDLTHGPDGPNDGGRPRPDGGAARPKPAPNGRGPAEAAPA